MKDNFFIDPPSGLLEKIIKRIHKEERILIWRRIFIFSATFMVSVIGFLPASKMLLSDFSRSGFFNFFSLMFTDFSAISICWESFAMTLLQTLPAASVILFLAILLVLLQSIKSLTKNVKNIINIAV